LARQTELKTLANKKDVSYQSLAKIYLARQIALERGFIRTENRERADKHEPRIYHAIGPGESSFPYPWEEIIGMRNRLIHGIDPEIVWQSILSFTGLHRVFRLKQKIGPMKGIHRP
jgi:hypothetical protein